MSKSREYEERTEQLLLPMIEAHQFELIDVEYVKEAGSWFLRAYIDKEGGITIDDCELISRELSDKLDTEDFIEDSYILEVSSPGLGRQLKKDKDFKRSIGEEVDLRLFKAIKITEENGREASVKELNGILEGYDEETVTIRYLEEEKITIPRKEIAIIKLALDF